MSLSVAEHILNRMSISEELTAEVGDRMFPVALSAETKFPFICYERSSVSPLRTKDIRTGEDAVTVDVFVFSDNYKESVQVAELVRKALDCTGGIYSTFRVSGCYMTDAMEAFSDNVYMQQLVFNLTTTSV